MENNSIEMKIAKTAAQNWGQQEPTTIEEAKGITWGSEVAAINGIARVLKLDVEDVEKLVGTEEQDGEIYTQEVISEDIASKIKSEISKTDKNESVLEILSTIHDEWVKNNSNNFLKENDKGERRNKERQFVPLELLDWGEVQSDLLFLKPILEASGIELDEKELKDRFEVAQLEFLIDKGITSHENLVKFLSRGAWSYPALDGIETKFGGNIEQLLKDSTVLEEMAGQIESRVKIKSEKEIAKDLLYYSNNPEMEEILWADTIVDNPNFSENKCPRINGPISRKEILLSKTIGIPYPKYITAGIVDYNHDEYRNEIRRPRDSEREIVDRYKDTLDERMKSIRTKSFKEEVKQELLNGDSQIGFVRTVNTYAKKHSEYNYEEIPPFNNRAMPHNLYTLGKKFGIGFPRDVITVSGNYEPEELTYSNTFSTSNTKEISIRENALAKLREKIDKDNTGKYDRKGIVYLPRYSNNRGRISYSGQPFAKVEEILEIEVTQRELAKAGILPKDFKWIEKARVSTKDIAEAGKEQALTTTEIGGVKGFINKLVDKFKGKEERENIE